MDEALLQIPDVERKPFENFLQELLADGNTLLAGKNIHINWHFTDVNFLVLNALEKAGANVTVSAIDGLVCHQDLLKFLHKAKIPFFASANEIQQYYSTKPCHIYWDCGAKLLDKLKPVYFGMELTHTDPDLYKDIDYLVVNLDSSLAKSCETRGGTGDGFCRALIEAVLKGEHEPYYLQEVLRRERFTREPITLKHFSEDKREGLVKKALVAKKYIVFGYGKVGTGICNALLEMGVPSQNITVIDTNKIALNKANVKRFQTYFLDGNDPQSIKKIKQALEAESAYVVGATGRLGAIAEYFSVENFNRRSYFANMSTEDDFGKFFPPERFVKGRREIFNFGIKHPTKLEYLAPPFGLALYSAKQTLRQGVFSKGLRDTNKDDSFHVLDIWKKEYSREYHNLLTDSEFSALIAERKASSSKSSPERSKSAAIFDHKLPPRRLFPLTPELTQKSRREEEKDGEKNPNKKTKPLALFSELTQDMVMVMGDEKELCDIDESSLERTSSNEPMPSGNGSRTCSPTSFSSIWSTEQKSPLMKSKNTREMKDERITIKHSGKK